MRARRDASGGEDIRAKPAASLQIIENTVRELLVQVQDARRKEDAQAKRITQLEHENHALHLALQKTKDQRAKDRQVIEMWRQYTSQEQPMTDVSTQEGVVGASNSNYIPSSPPVVPQLEVPPQQDPINSNVLTQRVIPMSIDVDELFEYEIKHENEGLSSDDKVISSSQSNLITEPQRPTGPAKRSASAVQGSQESIKVADATARRTESTPEFNRARDPYVDDLLRRTWHPSDFVLNPNPRLNGPVLPVHHAFVEAVRSKKRRSCTHGKDCKACSTFCDLMGSGVMTKKPRQGRDLSQQETPAGFWRTEFPDSADAEQDQMEAEAQWSAEGERRLLEALCEGKYLFKDRQLREDIHARLSANA